MEFEHDFRRAEEELADELANWLPLRGDRLFQESLAAVPLDPLGATLPGSERSPSGRWTLYADGFLEAADRLVDGYSQTPDPALVYPILALYRHHLELTLKILVRYCLYHILSLEDEDIAKREEKLATKHSLTCLWDYLKRTYPRCNAETSKQTVDAFEQMLRELDASDPNSQAARYPVFKTGEQTLIQFRAIDIQVLKAGVHKLSHYLGSIRQGIGLEIEQRQETESY